MYDKRKLAMIVSNFAIGGGQKVVLDLLKSIDKDRFTIKLFVLSSFVENQFTNELKKQQISVDFVTMKSKNKIANYIILSKALKKFNPDVLHIHFEKYYPQLWGFLNRKKMIFTIHSQAYRTFSNKLCIKYHSFLTKHKKDYFLVAVSKNIAKETANLLGISQERVFSVYNPIHLENVDNTNKKKESSEILRFINVARFHPVKNQKLLIDAFQKLLLKFPNAELFFAGDGDLLNSCRDYAVKLKIEKNVHFLGNVEDVSHQLYQSDVFVLSSDSEAFPVSILEAMAHKLPIVATNVGGVPEIVTDNGFVVPPRDSESLSYAMYQLCKSRDLRKDMGEKSYREVQKFSASKIIEKYQEIYLLE